MSKPGALAPPGQQLQKSHPDQRVMSYEEFFRERQEARYGGKGRVGRCC